MQPPALVQGKLLEESLCFAPWPALVNDHPVAGLDLEATQQVDANLCAILSRVQHAPPARPILVLIFCQPKVQQL